MQNVLLSLVINMELIQFPKVWILLIIVVSNFKYSIIAWQNIVWVMFISILVIIMYLSPGIMYVFIALCQRDFIIFYIKSFYQLYHIVWDMIILFLLQYNVICGTIIKHVRNFANKTLVKLWGISYLYTLFIIRFFLHNYN